MALHDATRYSSVTAAASSVRRGGSNIDTLYSERRLYDLTSKVIEENRSYLPMFHILTNKISRKSVSDPEPKFFIDSPWEGKITPVLQTAYWTLELASHYVNFVNVGDLFVVNGIYYRAGTSSVAAADWTTTPGSNNSSTLPIYAPEVIRVVSVDVANNSIGVARGDGTDTSVCATLITADMRIIKMINALEENSGPTVAWNTEVDQDQIYIQSSDCVYQMSDIQLKTKDIMGTGEDEWMRRKRMATRYMLEGMERNIIWGREAKVTLANSGTSNPRRMTGGFIEFIANESGNLGDAQSKIFNMNGNPLQLSGNYADGGLIDLTAKLSEWGSKEKLCFCGRDNISYWAEMFAKYFTVNDQLSKHYGFKVVSYESPHMTLHLIHCPPLSIASHVSTTSQTWQNFSSDMLIVDPAYAAIVFFAPVIHDDVTPVGMRGRKGRGQCDWGLWRAFPDAHGYVFNVGRAA